MANGIMVNHTHTWWGQDWDCQLDVVTDNSRIGVSLFANTAAGFIRGKDWHFIGRNRECRLQHEGFIQALAHGD